MTNHEYGLLPCLAAIGRAMAGEFNPRAFLDDFSAQLQPLVPHDRLGIAYLDENHRTFSVFAEHAALGLLPDVKRYTFDFDRETRFVVDEARFRAVFAGDVVRVDDLTTDPRFTGSPAPDGRGPTDLRSMLLVPLESGRRQIGALIAGRRTPAAYDEVQAGRLREAGRLIGPFIENLVLLHRERRRHRRLQGMQGIARALEASLDVRDIFARLAEAVRPMLDFDGMTVVLFTASGRELERFAGIEEPPLDTTMITRASVEDLSLAPRILAGETILIADAQTELDPSYPVDRLAIDAGSRASIGVPLVLGEHPGGVLWFSKRRPNWFDRTDMEVATAIAAQLVLAIQHQRLAEDQRRLAVLEDRAQRLERRVASLQHELGGQYGFDRILGRSPALTETLARAAKVASTDTTVLLSGESGTGKELVARAIHHASPRAEGPFVAINCAALPDTLLESELFGHERGAFTGADRQKPGRFELAAGGTLFLDEIAELSPGVQAKLLRVLQEREYQRVGGTVTLCADVRLIAATNRDLEREVEIGHFRHDLFYRLSVFIIHLPPLRDREDDVLLLADHFVRTLGSRMAKGDLVLSRDARDTLLQHSWPGNIRELQNAIERGLISSENSLITAAHLGIGPSTAAPNPAPQPAAKAPRPPAATSLLALERTAILEALWQAHGNKAKAAALLGITRFQLYRRLRRRQIPPTT